MNFRNQNMSVTVFEFANLRDSIKRQKMSNLTENLTNFAKLFFSKFQLELLNITPKALKLLCVHNRDLTLIAKRRFSVSE